MAELPEITKLSSQMRAKLTGKTIKEVVIEQEKCTNVPVSQLKQCTQGARIVTVNHKGKWIITHLDNGQCLLLSLGMGADVLYFDAETPEQEKYHIKVVFDDDTGVSSRFWWFGKFLLSHKSQLGEEKNTKDIGIDPFDPRFTPKYFNELLAGKRTQIKAFLMNQKNIGGIGNMYMHDILFGAKLHPAKKICDLTQCEIDALYGSIQKVLCASRDVGAFHYEMDLFGQKGGFTSEYFAVGYKENQPCPVCGEAIQIIKTGSTSSYICPKCQAL